MPPVRLVLALVMTFALTIGGCGSSDGGGGSDSAGGTDSADTKVFEAEGIEITFDYPEDMKKATDASVDKSVGAAATVTAGVGYDERNGIFVQRYDLTRSVGKGELEAVKPEVDKLFEQGSGQPADGKATEIGGLPALEYQSETMDRPGEESRFLVIFDGEVEYTINCQSNEKRREDIKRACDTALETVKKKT